MKQSSKANVQGKKKASSKALRVIHDEPVEEGSGKTIEQIYQKKSQLEHILLRPDTYGMHCWLYDFALIACSVGSVEKVTQDMWVYDDESGRIVNESTTFVSSFYFCPIKYLRQISRSPGFTKYSMKYWWMPQTTSSVTETWRSCALKLTKRMEKYQSSTMVLQYVWRSQWSSPLFL